MLQLAGSRDLERGQGLLANMKPHPILNDILDLMVVLLLVILVDLLDLLGPVGGHLSAARHGSPCS